MGPEQIASQSYGDVTGRVTSIAIDPADATGNTVYLGTTGGGVWKSTDAAGPAASVLFTPLTDTLPVFSANAGGVAMPSLSIGAVSVGQASGSDVLLAGTGDPNDASDSYYGEGILRSADGGVTWTLAQQSDDGTAGHHSFVGLGVAGFAWSGTTPGLVVAAFSQAAEGVLVNAPDTNYSVMGLYYSQDAGKTWQMGIIEDGSQIVQIASSATAPGNAATAVVWNPVRQMFYAAVRFHGYYQSPDGILWTRLANQPGTGLTAAACPANPNGTGSPACPIFRGALAVQPQTGDTFALTVDANNRDQGLWQDVCGLSGSSCANGTVTFGRQLDSAPLEVGSGTTPTTIPQADYDLSLAAVATGTGAASDTLLFAGTVDLYRCALASPAAGCVLRNTTNATNGCAAPAKVSPAQHAIAVLADEGDGGTLPLLYVGNDGGLWRSTDGVNQQQTPCSPDDATHFQNLNAGIGSLAEVDSFAEDPSDPETLLVSVGANGTAATGSASTTAAWPQIAAGEGGTVAIDPADPQNWYVSTEAGVSLDYCGNGSSCAAADFTGSPTIGYAQVDGDASLVDPPFLLDPSLTGNVAIGTCRVWRGPAQSGAGWPGPYAIGSAFDGSHNAACGGTDAMVRSLAAGGPETGMVAAQDAGSSVLYAGMAGSLDGGATVGGHIFANYASGSASGSTAWTDIAASPVSNASGTAFNPGGFDISSVAVDPHDATGRTVYATVMGFAGNGVNAAHVYRSTDGGASWTNISSNLPNAPANSLVVDPNDANTLYVAMDTGVYATAQVTSCTTSNCWSVFGTGLPNAPVVELQAASGIATGDGRFGELRAATYGRGIWQIPLLNDAPSTAPAMTLNPSSLTFAAQAVSTASTAQTITVTNNGTAALTVTSVVAPANFAEIDTCVRTAIAVGATCTVQVKFLPAATGPLTGTLTVYGNVAGGQATASLAGTGAPPAAIILTPITLNFPSTGVGATSAAQNIVVANTGGVTATLATPTVPANFVLAANTCAATLAASSSCTVSVEFQPTSSGAQSGYFSLVDNIGTQTASLSGVGVLPATDSLAPLSLTFAAEELDTASATQQVTLTNTGDAPLLLIAARIASGDFTVVNGCGNSLNGHSSCSLLVAYVPRSVGAETGLLTVSDEYRSQSVSLSGTGVAPPGVSISPVSTLAFAATGVGQTAPAQTVTLTNNGGLPLVIQSIAMIGDFAIVAGSDTCGASLAVGTACTLQVVFTPTAPAARTGTLTVTDDAATSPQTLQLSGTGVDFSLSANGSTTQTVSAGSEAAYSLLLSSDAGVPGSVEFTCAGAPTNATCTVNPSSSALGGTAPITVTVATDMASLSWPELPGSPHLPPHLPWLALLLPTGLLGLGRQRARRLGTLALLGCIFLMAGCAASRMIPLANGPASSNPANPTPSGTYTLTVSATAAGTGLVHTINLTLIVQ